MMKKQKLLLGILFLLITGSFFFSCKDNGTNPKPDEDSRFSFKVVVKDAAGNPISGLRVSAWGILSIENQLTGKAVPPPLSKTNQIQATSSLNFSIAGKSLVFLSVFNPRNQKVDTLFKGYADPGLYHVTWAIPWGTPSGVYICRFHAENDSVHIQDSIYAVYHTSEPEQNVVGWTDQGGLFEETDIHCFPKNFDLPMFVRTSPAGPEAIGTFEYTDSVSVILTDTVSQLQQKYMLRVGKQNNVFNLSWNPQGIASVEAKEEFSPTTKISISNEAVFHVSDNLVALELINSTPITGIQFNLSNITETPTNITSIFDTFASKVNGTTLTSIFYFSDGYGTIPAGQNVVAIMHVKIQNPNAVIVSDIFAADTNHERTDIQTRVVKGVEILITPSNWKLYQNYPNPFN